MTSRNPEQFRFTEVGNWYSEYQCLLCRQFVIVEDDCDHPCDPGYYHECDAPQRADEPDMPFSGSMERKR